MIILGINEYKWVVSKIIQKGGDKRTVNQGKDQRREMKAHFGLRSVVPIFFLLLLFLYSCSTFSTQNQSPKTVLDCRKLGASKSSAKCIQDLAIQSKVSALCDYAKGIELDCYSQFISKYSTVNCKTNLCFLATARKKKDCQKIQPLLTKLECLTKIAPNIQAGLQECQNEKLQDNYSYLCLSSLASQKKNPLACAQIPNINQNRIFIKNCYFRLAKEQKNQKLCDNLGSIEDKQKCLFLVEIEKGNTAICSQINPLLKNDCLANLGIFSGDIAYCKQITAKREFQFCVSQTVQANDLFPEVCEEVADNQSIYAHCIQETARDPKTCQILLNEKEKKVCLDNLTIQSIDVVSKVP